MSAIRGASWFAAISEVGRVRDHNEDAVLAEPPLFVVADGLGGHEAGEVASALAVETLRDNAPRKPEPKALARAVRAANREVIRAAREGIGRQGMGTTLTAAIVDGTRIALAHVGDSRAYLLHGGAMRQLTEDHSMVADMVRRGTITEEESRYHPNRSVITRALGTDPNMVADTYEVTAEHGDVLLLASDGLTGMVEDPDIAAVIQRNEADLQVAARALVEAANAAGGHDNISAVLVRISDDGTASTSASRSASVAGGSAAPRARGWFSIVAWIVAFALVVGGIGYATYRYATSRAYLTAENGQVVVYQGVPGEFAGIALHAAVPTQELLLSSLPPVEAARVTQTITTASLDQAMAIFERLVAESVASGTPSTAPSSTVGVPPGGSSPTPTPTTP